MDSEPRELMRQLTAGQLSRRQFLVRATALGCSASAIAGYLAACGATPTAAATAAATRAATAGAPAASPGAAGTPRPATSPAAVGSPRPAGSPATTGGGVQVAAPPASPGKRGGGGALKVLWWQAPTILNTHLAQGQKDTDASRPVYEPLAVIDGEGKFIPILAAEIPTRENGGLAADYKRVTWKLKSGVKWSDGQPFTAKDVVFTWEYVTDKATASGSAGLYSVIDKCEALDETTVKVTFTEPQAGWFNVFVGQNGLIMPEHIFRAGKGAPAKNFPANLAPIGTGPYKVDEFRPGDVVTYSINPTYRDPNGPFFDTITFKGGGDAPSAARAVLQTGDYDYAWNLQVAGTILDQLEQSGGKGAVATIPGASTERLLLNFTDPNKEVDGERSSLKAPHPFLTDKAVRQALALACDKKTIVDAIYKKTGEVANNLLYNPPQYNSPNTTSEYDLNKANQLLDQAGYARSGQYRAKGGVQMKVVYQTTVNAVRQKEQQLIKDAWEKVGIQTELKSVDSAVFFSSDEANPDTASHFYADFEMFTNSAGSPDLQSYLAGFTTKQIPSKANKWGLNNNSRYSNPAYDKLNDDSARELDPAKRTQLFRQQFKLLYDDAVGLPLVGRKLQYGATTGIEGINGGPWTGLTWNIANWTKR